MDQVAHCLETERRVGARTSNSPSRAAKTPSSSQSFVYLLSTIQQQKNCIPSFSWRLHRSVAAIMIIAFLLLSVLTYATWSLIALEANYKRARSMNIPLIRIPIDPLNIPWQVFGSHIW